MREHNGLPRQQKFLVRALPQCFQHRSERLFHVAFDSGLVEYEWNDADQIALAYAVTVHKSQGSEFPVVILPLLTQHFVMLERNLVYTGMTRAKKLLIMVGSHRALGIAVRKSQSNRRWTRLAGRLRDPGSIPSLDEPEQPDWD